MCEQTGFTPDFAVGVDHVIAKKDRKTRPPWNPSTLEDVSLEDIRGKLFDPKRVENMPQLEVPEDCVEGDPSIFALPSEEEIGYVVRGDHETSGDTALTFDELVQRCTFIWQKHGVRDKVIEVLERRCVVDKSTDIHTLKWVHTDGEEEFISRLQT